MFGPMLGFQVKLGLREQQWSEVGFRTPIEDKKL